MGDYVEGLKESTKEQEKALAISKQETAELQKQLSLRQKISQSLRGGSSSQIANNTSTTGPTANNGGGSGTNGYRGNNPYSADQAGPYGPGQASPPPKIKSYDALSAFASGVGKAAMAATGFLPTVDEATTTQLAQSRIKFFGGGGYLNPLRDPVAPQYAGNAAYRLQRDLSNLGTALTPSDSVAAINNGMQMGLLPSLKNYGMGKGSNTTDPSHPEHDKTRFSGILGGAALASNLSPGIGIQGGMQAMGALNQAQSVNMLKMIGVQVRNSKGTGMNDLPEIIEQIYNVLVRGDKNVTAEDFATSLMPGNAVDSLLNQYLGGDANLKNVVIAGLFQRLKSRDNLRISGTKQSLMKTGGTTLEPTSISGRSTAELGLIQSYADPTVNAMNTANRGLMTVYGKLATGNLFSTEKDGNFSAKPLIEKIQQLQTKLDVYSGARGNAGQAVLDSILKGAISGFNGSGAVGKALFGAVGGAATLEGMTHINTDLKDAGRFNGDFYKNPNTYPGDYYSQPSNPGPVYTGTITVNVAAPPGQDPYSYGLAIGQAMTARS